MTSRLQVYIEGRVQGVGFRYSTARRARDLGLNGWVRNLPDGRVEAEMEGEQAALEEMLAWCHAGPSVALVRNVVATWSSGEPRYDKFSLRY